MKKYQLKEFENYEVKKFLEIDYPRSKAARHYTNFLALRATWISNNKRQYGNPGVELRGILSIKKDTYLCFQGVKFFFTNVISRHSTRPNFSFNGQKKNREKRKSLSPDKMFFPARLAGSLKCKGRKASGCISGRSNSTSRRTFCKGVRPHPNPEESPFKQDISWTGISYGDGCGWVWNSREMSPWERITITPGCPFFGSFLWADKEMNRNRLFLECYTL